MCTFRGVEIGLIIKEVVLRVAGVVILMMLVYVRWVIAQYVRCMVFFKVVARRLKVQVALMVEHVFLASVTQVLPLQMAQHQEHVHNLTKSNDWFR